MAVELMAERMVGRISGRVERLNQAFVLLLGTADSHVVRQIVRYKLVLAMRTTD